MSSLQAVRTHRQNVVVMILAATAAAAFTVASIIDQRAMIATGALTLVGLTAAAPRYAVLAAIPVFMSPWDLTLNGTDVRTGLVALLVAGTLLGSLPKLGCGKTAFALTLPLCATVLVGLYANPPATILASPFPANNAYTLVLTFLLIPTYAVVRPPWQAVLTTLALSGTCLAAYSMVFGIWSGGRNQLSDVVNPNSTGHFAAIAAVIALSLLSLTKQAMWLLLALFDVTEVVLTQSRGGFIVLAAGVALLIIIRMKPRTRGPYLMFATVGCVLALPLFSMVADRIFSLRDQDHLEVEARQEVAKLAIKLVLNNPVNGIGYRKFLDYSTASIGRTLDTHNDFLRLAAECGLPAIGLLLGLIGVAAWRMSRRGPIDKVWLIPTLTAVAVFGFANSFNELRVSLPAWVLLGLCLSRVDHRNDRMAHMTARRRMR